MRHHRPALWLVALVLLAASCGAGDGGPAEPTPTTSPPTTSTTATTTPTETTGVAPTATTAPAAEVLTVNDMLDTRPGGDVRVQGMLIDTGAGMLLCEALLESFPPQCGGRWMVVTNPEALDVALTTEGRVTWADQPVTITGRLEGDRLVVAGSPSGVEPTADDLALVEAFVVFARAGGGDVASLPIAAEGLSLGLATELLVDRTASELSDPDAWVVDLEPFRARVGPYSALELLAEDRPTDILIGPHNHCAAVPVAPPDEVAELRRVSVFPVDAASCIEWWTVDFFVDADGTVAAITLDLWEP